MKKMLGMLACLLALGCEAEPQCPAAGSAPATPAFAPFVTAGTHVCADSTAERLRIWTPSDVHRANMDSVDTAQSNGWDRVSDNWYSSTDHSDSPKWSELSGPAGNLRIDVEGASEGTFVTVQLTP